MIDLVDVSCRAGDRWVLREATLRVEPGEAVALTGPNGGGKSLLLAVCATLARAASGTVRIAGHDARTSGSSVRRLVGYLSDEVGIDPVLTAREDLAFFAEAHGIRRALRAEAAGEGLRRWGLDRVADEPVARLSRGLRRRLGLARACLHRPRVLLLDDPTVGLDAEARVMLQGELRRHLDEGAAVLLASHDADAIHACDRTVALVEGRLCV